MSRRLAKQAALEASLQAECDAFNARVAVGAKVSVKLDGKDELVGTITRTAAQIMGGHSAVIWLEHVSGSYLLDRVKPATDAEWETLQHAGQINAAKGDHRLNNFAVRVEPSRNIEHFEDEQNMYITYNGRQEYPTTLSRNEAEQVIVALQKAFNIN